MCKTFDDEVDEVGCDLMGREYVIKVQCYLLTQIRNFLANKNSACSVMLKYWPIVDALFSLCTALW